MSIFRGMSNQSWPTIIVLAVLTMLVVLLTWMLCFDDTAHADGWSSDIWPSQEYPMQGWRQLHECHTATVERCRAAGVGLPSTSAVSNYLDGRTELVNIKSALKTAIPYFLNTNQLDFSASAVASNGFLIGSMTAADVSDSFPWQGSMIDRHWTATGLLADAFLPTNYFEFTPYLGLSGMGAYTNDTTVAYPHGFTNSFTINGGSVFPASRTNWYDTDYGLTGYTAIVARLLVTDRPAGYGSTGPTNAAGKILSYVSSEWGMGSTWKWSGATNFVEVNWPYWFYEGPNVHLPRASPYGAHTLGYYVGGVWPYIAIMQHTIHSANLSGIATSLSHQVEFYVYPYFSTGSNYVYDSYGDHSWPSNQLTWLETVSAVTNAIVYGIVETGSTNKLSSWCEQPTSTATGKGRGYYIIGRAAIRWDVTGGFQFK